MGYRTDFLGSASITPTLKEEHKIYLQAFSEIRHMRRDVEMLKNKEDKLRQAVGLPLGNEAEFYVGSVNDGYAGQNRTDDIIDYNQSPGQKSHSGLDDFNKIWNENQKAVKEGRAIPGLWCGWTVNDEGTELEWDGTEKFYCYIEWMIYLVNNFFQPWGYKLNGQITWQGEEVGDVGKIIIKDNRIGVVDFDGNKELYEPIATHHDTKEIK